MVVYLYNTKTRILEIVTSKLILKQRQRQRDRETERQRDRETERQRDRDRLYLSDNLETKV